MRDRKQTPTEPGIASSGGFTDDAPTTLHKGDETQSAPPVPRAAQMVAISMKTPTDLQVRVEKVARELPHIKLRAMSEFSRAQMPQNLGNLAPPYDPAEARNRTVREYIVWGSLAVILACGIALAIWFAAT